ncbi:MAG: hypothetical protein QM763_15840 [Agriterribacter sp.]
MLTGFHFNTKENFKVKTNTALIVKIHATFALMEEALSHIRKMIDAVQPLTEEEWVDFAGIWRSFATKRKELLTRAGETEKYLYLVQEGVQIIIYLL